MDTPDSKALVAAIQSQTEILAGIGKSLHRLMLLASIMLTHEQRREMAMTDELIARGSAK